MSGRTAIVDLVDHLAQFEGPPEHFLLTLLAVQCQVAGAQGGAILRGGADGKTEVVAVFPPLAEREIAPVWLAHAAQSAAQVVAANQTVVSSVQDREHLYGQPAKHYLVLIPLRGGCQVRGVAAFALETEKASELASVRERLELTLSFLSLYEMRLTLHRRQADLGRLRTAVETVATVNKHDRFVSAAMAFCNDVASRWRCERVSLGFLKGRYVQLRAMSHTEEFSRKMRLVQDIESAMEECLDQDVEVLHPAPADASYVSRVTAELAARHGPTATCSLPLRRGGEAVAVLTLERSSEQPLTPDEIESLRLACDLCVARLMDLHDHDRWIGARCVAGMRRGLAALVGPRHTWAKLGAILVFAVVAFLSFVKGEYRVESPFVLEATQQQVVPAPFDGYLKTVTVAVGDLVEADKTVLATLDTAELRLRLAAAKAERAAYLKQMSVASDEAKTAEAQMAQAQADKVAAQVDLLGYQIQQATVRSRMSGIVIVGDLQRQLGAPVKIGEVLFEVAPLEALRAELAVPEDQVVDVKVGYRGELATASYPGRRIAFVAERVNPVAEVVNQKNVFKVRARLGEPADWMRPGMEGTAKIDAGRRTYGWIWSRRLVNWVRMKLWW